MTYFELRVRLEIHEIVAVKTVGQERLHLGAGSRLASRQIPFFSPIESLVDFLFSIASQGAKRWDVLLHSRLKK